MFYSTVGWKWLSVSLFLSTLSMFSKEQGITVTVVCLAYEAFIVLKVSCVQSLLV